MWGDFRTVVERSKRTCDPQKDDTVILQYFDVHLAHLIICHCAVGQVLVDLPGRVCHDYAKLAQHAHVKGADVTRDPLGLAQGLQVVWYRWLSGLGHSLSTCRQCTTLDLFLCFLYSISKRFVLAYILDQCTIIVQYYVTVTMLQCPIAAGTAAASAALQVSPLAQMSLQMPSTRAVSGTVTS